MIIFVPMNRLRTTGVFWFDLLQLIIVLWTLISLVVFTIYISKDKMYRNDYTLFDMFFWPVGLYKIFFVHKY